MDPSVSPRPSNPTSAANKLASPNARRHATMATARRRPTNPRQHTSARPAQPTSGPHLVLASKPGRTPDLHRYTAFFCETFLAFDG